MPSEQFTVPDAQDLGIKQDPLKVQVRTPNGDPVRPIVVVAAINRELRRREQREAKKQRERGEAVPLYVAKPPAARVLNQQMADMVLKEWETYHRHFPLKTLQDYLDERTAKTMEEAFLAGRPLNRDDVRRALANLHQEAIRERN